MFSAGRLIVSEDSRCQNFFMGSSVAPWRGQSAHRSERTTRILSCDRELQSPAHSRQRTNRPPHRQYNSSKMGRLHSNGKGISASAIPYSRNPPAWLKTTPEQVVDQVRISKQIGHATNTDFAADLQTREEGRHSLSDR